MKRHKIEVLKGRGRLQGKQTVEVEGGKEKQQISAEVVIIATGSRPVELPSIPFDGRNILSSDHVLSLKKIPKSMLIVGGGYVGCEWASIFSALDTKVTVVEMLDRLLPNMDASLGRELQKRFKKDGTNVRLKAKVDSVRKTPRGVEASVGKDKTTVEKIIVCVGRKPNCDDLGLESAGVEVEDGRIKVNEFMQTSVPHVYAIGDVTGGMMLAHVAYRHADIAVGHIKGDMAKMDYRVVPACVFTHPEIGTVGMTQDEAEKAGLKVRVSEFQFRASGKALCMGEPEGLVKVVANESDGEIVGVHIIGPHASDLISEAALAMQLECTVEEIARTIHAHPSLPEALKEAAEGWLAAGGSAVHG